MVAVDEVVQAEPFQYWYEPDGPNRTVSFTAPTATLSVIVPVTVTGAVVTVVLPAGLVMVAFGAVVSRRRRRVR